MAKQKIDDEKQKKPATRYDEKMERRRAKAKKEARDDKILGLAGIVVALLIAGVIIAAIATSVINKNKATKDVYVKVGQHEITKLEYNYYYNITVNNYLNMYSSILPYMGLDTTRNYADQAYSETMSWKDAFDEMTIAQIKQTKSAVDDANANGFAPDLSQQYEEFRANMAEAVKTTGMSEAQYYKASFGSFATKANMESYIKDQLMVEAYYDELMEKNRPSEEEITAQYEANKKDYDKVSYRSFTFKADLAEDAAADLIETAMKELSVKADKMAGRRTAGEDFKALSLEYAKDEDKASYEDGETDASLTEKAGYLSVSTLYHDWLFDDSRAAGDITVVEDESGRSCYVVEFVERVYDETTNATISDTIANQKTSEYMTALAADYEVVDVAGDLVYLTVDQNAGEALPEDVGGTDGAEPEAAETTAAEIGSTPPESSDGGADETEADAADGESVSARY